MNTKSFIYILILVLFGCTDYPEYSEIPRVEFLSAYTYQDSTDKHIDFRFTLYDGDGNLWLSAKDTTAPFIDSFAQNFYADVYVKEQGSFVKKPYNYSFRIPQIRADDNHKFIKAEVSVELTFAKQVFHYDTIMITYFVYDKKLNKSNIDSSSIIVFQP